VNGLALFSGVGGLELALSLAIPSFRCMGYVELDSFAASVLVARMEGETVARAPIWDDVRSFDGALYRDRVDLVSGGFPCTDLSVANHAGKGLDGERSGLWTEFARVVREVRPRLVFVENVPALATRGLDRVLGDLHVCGFDAVWDVFSCDGVGAPHLRRRLFLLARRLPDPGGAELREESGRGRRERDGAGAPLARTMGEPMGDPDGGRRENERLAELRGVEGERGPEPDRSDFDRRELWPPGPENVDGWRRWLAAGGPAPALPGIRRGATRVPAELDDLSDRLRCLGNGVSPLAGAYAYRTLAARIGEPLEPIA